MPGDHLYGGNTPGFNACILTLEVGTSLPASIDGERHRAMRGLRRHGDPVAPLRLQ
jgi:hypothetical protein